MDVLECGRWDGFLTKAGKRRVYLLAFVRGFINIHT
jgi:hypothetical protein